VGLKLVYPEGATPLDPDESAELIPSHVATQGQLNEWEQQNILEGERWAFSRRNFNPLSLQFSQDLHKHMFGRTWKWAGRFRTTEKNIGVDPTLIGTKLTDLFRDVEAQLAHQSEPIDELAARFHHRLVSIHPFPNGNGRFSRTMTDLLLKSKGKEAFTWGGGSLIAGEIRKRYISALRAADANDLDPLFAFVRSAEKD
jgi:Fic-DOC domain mobile mystery protein B